MSKKKLGFALGSGGARGVAHIGFLQAMEENGIRPDYIAGCSMGSVVGAAYSAGLKPKEIYAVVEKLRLLDLLQVTKRKGGLFDTQKIKKILIRYLGEASFNDLKIPFACVAVDLMSQKLVEFREGDVPTAVVASSSIPGVFKPIEKDGMRLVDGGVFERVPVKLVKDMGADTIIAVDVLGKRNCSEKMPGTVGMLWEIFNVMDYDRTVRRREENKKIIDCWIEPELGNMSEYMLKQSRFAYEKGYEAGLKHVPIIQEMM